MIAVYNQETSPRSMKGVWSMKLGRKCVFAAPATLCGGLGDPLPGGRQHIRFGRKGTLFLFLPILVGKPIFEKEERRAPSWGT